MYKHWFQWYSMFLKKNVMFFQNVINFQRFFAHKMRKKSLKIFGRFCWKKAWNGPVPGPKRAFFAKIRVFEDFVRMRKNLFLRQKKMRLKTTRALRSGARKFQKIKDEWMNEWMNDDKNEWLNDWMIKSKN